MLPDSMLVGLFVVTSVGLTMGTGYTKYAEAKESLGDKRPDPDFLNHVWHVLGVPPQRLLAWHRRYRAWF